MTYFLDEKPLPPRPASGLTGGLPTTWETFVARWQSGNLEGGYRNFEDREARSQERRLMLDRAIEAFGADSIRERVIQDFSGVGRSLPDDPRLWGHVPALYSSVEKMVEEDREQNPDRWTDWTLDEDVIGERTLERLRADYDEARQIAAMSRENLALDLAADFGSGTLNLKSAPWLLAGLVTGGGSWLRVIGQEAAINASVEAALLPSQFQAAEDLNIPDPDPLTQIAFAAGFGALFGAGGEALGRGLRHLAGRREIAPPSMNPIDAEVMTQRVEDALAGPNAFERAREVIESTRPSVPEPPPGRQPLVLLPVERVDLPEVTTEALPPASGAPARPVMDDQSLRAMAQTAIDDAEEAAAAIEKGATLGKRFPLLAELRKRGVRLDPDSPEGQELYSLLGGGREANRTLPGLFSRKAPRERPEGFDNNVASEWEERFPGISEAAGVENGYLSRDGLYDLIRREAASDRSWMHAMQEAQSIRSAARMSPVEEWQQRAGPARPDDLFINRDAMFFDRAEWEVERDIGQMIDEWFDQTGWGARLTDLEKAEVRAEMQKSGGDPLLLVERIAERELDYVDAADEVASDIPPGSPEEAGGGVAGAPGPVSGEAGGGAARVGHGERADFALQRTDAGDQFIVPGTDRAQTGVAQRQRAELAARQQQSMIRRGEQSRIEDDPDSLFGGAQQSLFDDPASPEARPVLDDVAADLRAQIEADGDFLVDMGDGKGERLASTVLDDLDQGDMVAARLDLCGKAPGGEA